MLYDTLAFGSGAPFEFILCKATEIEAAVHKEHRNGLYFTAIQTVFRCLQDEDNSALREEVKQRHNFENIRHRTAQTRPTPLRLTPRDICAARPAAAWEASNAAAAQPEELVSEAGVEKSISRWTPRALLPRFQKRHLLTSGCPQHHPRRTPHSKLPPTHPLPLRPTFLRLHPSADLPAQRRYNALRRLSKKGKPRT
ncbi:hypothetical protein B0H14DRAFT_3540134 [Mycena olivaceomarginata]|nr:hypothetical protein B0H14DRAFT_3540134 [Mycena olivaceomarginata]